MNSAGEPLCDKCSVNGSVDCPPRLNLSYFPWLRTQIVLRIHPINRPPVAQAPHILSWLCLRALSPCFLVIWLNAGLSGHVNLVWDNVCTSESTTVEDEKTIGCRAGASGGSHWKTLARKRKMMRGRRAEGGRGQGGERLSTLFFGCCTSCRALFLDLLVRGGR